MHLRSFEPRIFESLCRPAEDSHKGMNGKLLVIGGSQLFHASVFWSAQVASKIVDLVHFVSPAEENNDLVRQKIKAGFWEGIVVPWERVEEYIVEDDCVLIGPGMPREDGLHGGERPTKEIVDGLLKEYPDKKWVVDGGALQEVDSELLNGNMIITPHQGEWERLLKKIPNDKIQMSNDNSQIISQFSKEHRDLTILLKGQEDLVCRGDEVVEVAGGNAGMTKGGTGDVLAGLVAALYCKNETFLAAQAASYVNKKAGEALAERVGMYYNAGDLVAEVPKVLKQVVL